MPFNQTLDLFDFRAFLLELMMNKYRFYVAYFSNNRIKFGITTDIDKRMKYYVSEARRNDIQFVTWFASSQCFEKEVALAMERVFRFFNSDNMIPKQRESIRGDVDFFGKTISNAEELFRIASSEYCGWDNECYGHIVI